MALSVAVSRDETLQFSHIAPFIPCALLGEASLCSLYFMGLIQDLMETYTDQILQALLRMHTEC